MMMIIIIINSLHYLNHHSFIRLVCSEYCVVCYHLLNVFFSLFISHSQVYNSHLVTVAIEAPNGFERFVWDIVEVNCENRSQLSIKWMHLPKSSFKISENMWKCTKCVCICVCVCIGKSNHIFKWNQQPVKYRGKWIVNRLKSILLLD